MRLNSVFAVIVSGSLGVLALSSIGCGGGSGSSTGGTGGTGTGGSTGGTTAGSPCDPVCDANKGIKSDCVAIQDNSAGGTWGLRMSQLTINKPDELTAAKNPVVAGIIGKGVTMNLPDCNLNGGGTFSWLLQFDDATGKLKTGGALIQDDPTAGYCFVNGKLAGSETVIAPLTVDAKPDADGKFSVTVGGDVVVPIFLTDATNYVLLPLSNAKIINATVSSDHNCIGKYNADQLDPANQCLPPEFTNAASLDAYITLEAADSVPVESLKKTLCSLLTKTDDGGATIKKCPRDASGAITSKGDWCSKTDSAADANCADAFKLGADFAATAVKITGDCP